MLEHRGGSSRLYIPLQPPAGATTRTVDLRLLPDGRVGLPAYTSLTSLLRNCGSAQPWGLIDERGLAQIRASADIDIVLLDGELPLQDKRFPETGHAHEPLTTDPAR